jgi:4-hydroxy-tetrahydrodipicolinate synthase
MSEKDKDLFGQVLVALVTPMTPEGEVDWAATEKHIDYVISNGADGVVVAGDDVDDDERYLSYYYYYL